MASGDFTGGGEGRQLTSAEAALQQLLEVERAARAAETSAAEELAADWSDEMSHTADSIFRHFLSLGLFDCQVEGEVATAFDRMLTSRKFLSDLHGEASAKLIWEDLVCSFASCGFHKALRELLFVSPLGPSYWRPLVVGARAHSRNRIPIMHAATISEGHSDHGDADATVRVLLDAGARVDDYAAISSNGLGGQTALWCAAKGGYGAVVRTLLAAGHTVDCADEAGCTPLHCAATHRHVGVAATLVKAGADPLHLADWRRLGMSRCGGKEPPYTPWTCAVQNANPLMVDLFLRHGVSPDEPVLASQGYVCAPLISLLDDRVSEEDGEEKKSDADMTACVMLLIKAGCNVDVMRGNCCSPVLLAINNDLIDVLRALLDAGADPGAACKDGSSPIYFALLYGRSDMATLLSEAGADKCTACGDSGSSSVVLAQKRDDYCGGVRMKEHIAKWLTLGCTCMACGAYFCGPAGRHCAGNCKNIYNLEEMSYIDQDKLDLLADKGFSGDVLGDVSDFEMLCRECAEAWFESQERPEMRWGGTCEQRRRLAGMSRPCDITRQSFLQAKGVRQHADIRDFLKRQQQIAAAAAEARPADGTQKQAKMCARCGKTNTEVEATSGKMIRCGRCRAARYCGRACQKLHWREGHREACQARTKK